MVEANVCRVEAVEGHVYIQRLCKKLDQDYVVMDRFSLNQSYATSFPPGKNGFSALQARNGFEIAIDFCGVRVDRYACRSRLPEFPQASSANFRPSPSAILQYIHDLRIESL